MRDKKIEDKTTTTTAYGCVKGELVRIDPHDPHHLAVSTTKTEKLQTQYKYQHIFLRDDCSTLRSARSGWVRHPDQYPSMKRSQLTCTLVPPGSVSFSVVALSHHFRRRIQIPFWLACVDYSYDLKTKSGGKMRGVQVHKRTKAVEAYPPSL